MAENTFDRFSVFFTGGTVFLDGAAFPLGQLTTDVLNLDGEILTEIDRRVDDFMSVAWTLLQEKTDSAARSMQERINAVWDLIFDLPVYRNLRLDSEHNCGRYFLLTNGYHTCYCNNIAPGETKRTCRKVGAHRKANHPQGLSPAGVEYRKVYNRLKARKQRGKISRDEWNTFVSQIQEVLDMAEG